MSLDQGHFRCLLKPRLEGYLAEPNKPITRFRARGGLRRICGPPHPFETGVIRPIDRREWESLGNPHVSAGVRPYLPLTQSKRVATGWLRFAN